MSLQLRPFGEFLDTSKLANSFAQDRMQDNLRFYGANYLVVIGGLVVALRMVLGAGLGSSIFVAGGLCVAHAGYHLRSLTNIATNLKAGLEAKVDSFISKNK